jgi:hypothetical protein
MSMVTIIGRGHSGTRAISHTLSASGVFMGEPLNESGDLLPPEDMYAAARLLARYVHWKGGLEWDWSTLFSMKIPQEFTDLITSYLSSVLNSPAEYRGWKIPETTLVFPWIVRMFPDIKYIFWIRNPRDCILGGHLTDDLHDWGIDYPATDDIRMKRAISWKYQQELVKATPKPAHWMEIRLEDFILRQDETLARIEHFMGIPIARIEARRDSVERFKLDQGVSYYPFFMPDMLEYRYELPVEAK